MAQLLLTVATFAVPPSLTNDVDVNSLQSGFSGGNVPSVSSMLVAELNHRFLHGMPSADLFTAGVVVHANDVWENSNAPWEGNNARKEAGRNGIQDAKSDRLSVSLINKRLPFPYAGPVDSPGLNSSFSSQNQSYNFIIHPSVAKEALLCSYGEDAGTNFYDCPNGSPTSTWRMAHRNANREAHEGCIPGCMGATPASLRQHTWCGSAEPGWQGTWEYLAICPYPPSQLERMLRAHEARLQHEGKCRGDSDGCTTWNELVLDTSIWKEHLPDGIQAIAFYPPTVDPSGISESTARSVHARMQAAFPQAAELGVLPPLVSMDLSDGARPFKAVSQIVEQVR